jgi:hypothetical protein
MAFTTTMSVNLGLQKASAMSLELQGSMQCNVPTARSPALQYNKLREEDVRLCWVQL